MSGVRSVAASLRTVARRAEATVQCRRVARGKRRLGGCRRPAATSPHTSWCFRGACAVGEIRDDQLTRRGWHRHSRHHRAGYRPLWVLDHAPHVLGGLSFADAREVRAEASALAIEHVTAGARQAVPHQRARFRGAVGRDRRRRLGVGTLRPGDARDQEAGSSDAEKQAGIRVESDGLEDALFTRALKAPNNRLRQTVGGRPTGPADRVEAETSGPCS
jgi:hypothetical protein